EQLHAYTVKGEPYARLEDILSLYADTHVILIDPKGKTIQQRQELFDQLKLQQRWHEHLVIKSSAAASDSVGREARDAGFTTWGFYYHDQTLDTLERTQDAWSWLGLNHDAPQAAWDRIKALGKPVVG